VSLAGPFALGPPQLKEIRNSVGWWVVSLAPCAHTPGFAPEAPP
jgi:hypothetical protein